MNTTAWALAALGGLCGAISAYLVGGWAAAFAATGTALTTAASVWGYTTKPKT